MTSNAPSLNPFTSSDLVKSWPHSVSSWEKPSSGLNQKSMSVQSHPFLNSSGSFSKSSVIAPQSSGIFGEKWQVSNNSRLNPGFGSELPNRNGFYYGSSSGSKEAAICFPSISYDRSWAFSKRTCTCWEDSGNFSGWKPWEIEFRLLLLCPAKPR